jgi:lysyl-tRNA synthetase class 1
VQGSNRNVRAAELSRIAGIPPIGVPFKHLVNLVQIAGGNLDQIMAILRRHNLPVPERAILENRIAYAEHWLTHFCPPDMRLQLQDVLPARVAELSDSQRQALARLHERLQPEMDGDTIHTLVYGIAEEVALPAKEVFEAIYVAFLDQRRGPRVGWFLSSLDFSFVHTRLHDAAG